MKKVLIIEDEKPLRDVYALILETEGFNVNTAENGAVGIKKLKNFKPDLIILDILMPVMDGRVFLETAKLKQNYPQTKTIVVSNLSEPIDNLEKYGVIECFLKVNLSPVELASLAKKFT